MKRDKIIDDLLKKQPKGPGRETLTYVEKREYCYDRRRYCNMQVPSVEQFGYTDEEVFKLEFLSQSDVTHYVRNRWFAGKSSWEIGRQKSTVTRRANRIWQRIERGVNRIRRGGADGVYKVRRGGGYSSVPLGHLYAKNQEEATESAKLFFSYLVDDGRGVKVEFVKLGTVHEVHALNCETNEKANARIIGLEQEIAGYMKQIEGLKAQQTTLSLVEAQQMAVEMTD
jgi:hypothetical protein